MGPISLVFKVEGLGFEGRGVALLHLWQVITVGAPLLHSRGPKS